MADTKTSDLTALTGANVAIATDVLPIVDTSAGATKKITVAELFLSPTPTLTTPVLGVATATSINKVAITAPAASATLTIADGKTLTANASLTLTGTDSTTMTFPGVNATIPGVAVANTWTATQAFTAATSSVDLGANGGNVGILRFNGNTSGTVTIQPAAAAGTYTLTLPTDDGGAGTYLKSDGSGVLSWDTPAGGAGDMVLASIQTVTGAKTFGSAGAVGKLLVAGNTSGAITIAAAATAGTNTITLPAVTDTVAVLGANTFTAKQTITQATANAEVIASTGYSLTDANAQSLIDLAGTWNTSGTPTAIKLDITDTASNAASLLMDLKVGTVSKFAIAKGGSIVSASSRMAGPSGGLGFSAGATGNHYFYNDAANSIKVRSGMSVGWTSNANDAAAALDTALNRNAAGVVEINNGTAGTFRDLKLRNVIGQTGYTEMVEMTAPGAGAANTARIYAVDNGAGKTQLMVQFATGVGIQLAIEA